MASLWIRSGCKIKIKVSAETYQVGTHFKALIKASLVAPSRTLLYISCLPAPLWRRHTNSKSPPSSNVTHCELLHVWLEADTQRGRGRPEDSGRADALQMRRQGKAIGAAPSARCQVGLHGRRLSGLPYKKRGIQSDGLGSSQAKVMAAGRSFFLLPASPNAPLEVNFQVHDLVHNTPNSI